MCSANFIDGSHTQSWVMCATLCERNLLADCARIVEKQKVSKRKDESILKIVSDGLLALGYDACVCKSRWEKSASFPAGTISQFHSNLSR